MSKLYSENTTIVWNGNLVNGGSAKVTEFFNSLPATEHKLSSLDCQPVSGTENEIISEKASDKYVSLVGVFVVVFDVSIIRVINMDCGLAQLGI